MVYKIYSNATTDGAAFVDLPASGTLAAMTIVGGMTAGAGGVGSFNGEVSRAPTNQIAVNNPKGVLGSLQLRTRAASEGTTAQALFMPQERMQIGERLYLNCGGGYSNFGTGWIEAYLTIV